MTDLPLLHYITVLISNKWKILADIDYPFFKVRGTNFSEDCSNQKEINDVVAHTNTNVLAFVLGAINFNKTELNAFC